MSSFASSTLIRGSLDAADAQGVNVVAIQAVPAMFSTVEHAILLTSCRKHGTEEIEYSVTTHRMDEGNELGASFYTHRLADAHARFVERCKRATLDEIIDSQRRAQLPDDDPDKIDASQRQTA